MASSIMIIDDEEGIRLSLRGILEDEGYAVEEASSAEEGLQKAEASPPDMIFLDIWLPGMDGLETAHAILEEHPGAKIVMISSLAYDETVHEASKIGAKAFVCKPFDRDDLINTLERVLNEP